MATINLAFMRAALDNKYGHTTVELGDEAVVLRNPNRLPKEDRAAVLNFGDELATVGEDVDAQEELLRNLVIRVAETEAAGRALLEAIDTIPGDSLPLLSDVIAEYLGAQGETSPSES